MHVSYSLDADCFGDHSVAHNERKAAHDATANAEIGSNTGKQRSDGRELNDHLHRSLDGSVEARATAWTFHLVSIGGCIKLGACGGGELDRLHVGF